jgi:uncharacterized cupin superfamily protein
MDRVNLNTASPSYDESDPEGYRAGMDRFGKRLGATKLGASLYEVPPEQSICPYHYEYPEEEWLLVLDGQPTIRHPGGEDVLEPGDMVCFPTGPDGAHKVTNRTAETVRVLMFSTVSDPAVAVYPDSDKIGVFGTDEDDDPLFKRSSRVDYYDGET